MSRYLPAIASGLGLTTVLSAVRALAEETRLRILVLLRQGELTVSDLTEILGQSQPRVSRHLKLLVEARLVERVREGAWAFFRLSDAGAADLVLASILVALDETDERLAADRGAMARLRADRARVAESFFAALAPRWDNLRSLHVSEEAVEAAILDTVGDGKVQSLVDLGTGTGRMLQLLAPLARRAVGLDSSRAMREVARANLERAGLSGVELRQGDIYAPPLQRASFDLAVIHQVLHYLDDPARAVAAAAGLIAPGGRLLIVDLAPHAHEFLRESEGHRRLGLGAGQMTGWLAEAGLEPLLARDLAPPAAIPDGLTVSLWLARRPELAPPSAADIRADSQPVRTPEIA